VLLCGEAQGISISFELFKKKSERHFKKAVKMSFGRKLLAWVPFLEVLQVSRESGEDSYGTPLVSQTAVMRVSVTVRPSVSFPLEYDFLRRTYQITANTVKGFSIM